MVDDPAKAGWVADRRALGWSNADWDRLLYGHRVHYDAEDESNHFRERWRPCLGGGARLLFVVWCSLNVAGSTDLRLGL